MKHYPLTMVALLLSIVASAQAQPQTAADEKPSYKLYGFVRNYFYYDSRKNLQSSGGLFNQIPLDENINALGEDLNDVESARLLAITTRLGLNIKGPELFGAKSFAKIETDFNGFSSSTTMLRIRHAYVSLAWEKQSVLMGQAWHPMSGYVMPDVIGLATGSPFNPFSRTPQLRYDYKPTAAIKLTGALLYQLQYTSTGPAGASADYSKNSILPELYAAVEYSNGKIKIGAGADYLQIKPRTEGTVTIDGSDVQVKVDDKVAGISPFAYITYNHDKLSFKAKTVYGQNTAHLNMMSGYGVSAILDNGTYEYTPMKSSATWFNILYGKQVQVGLFGGYIKNLGAEKDIISNNLMYVRGFKNIDNIYRISPSVAYNIKNFSAGLEYELTTVAYGNTVDKKGKVTDTHNVSNNRFCLMVKYSF